MTASFQGGSQVSMVVNLAVVHDVEMAAVVVHGLVAARDVNDGQAAVRQSDPSRGEQAAAVWASMRHGIPHLDEFLDIH